MIPSFSSLGGLVVGLIIGSQGLRPSQKVSDQESFQVTTVTSPEARLIKQKIPSIELPSWLENQQGSVEKWSGLIEKYSKDDPISTAEKSFEAVVLASLVRPDEFASLMDLFNKQSQEEGLQHIKKALYAKWLENDPKGLEIWLGQLESVEQAESLAYIVTNAPQQQGDKVLKMYERFKDNIQLIDYHHPESTRHLLALYSQHRGVSELWKVYDELPKSFTKHALFDIGKTISKEDYPEFMDQFSRRLETNSNLDRQFERAIQQWSKESPEAAIEWLDKNAAVGSAYQATALTSFYLQGHDNEFPSIAARVQNDPAISKQFVIINRRGEKSI
jgi:hypothetical protein